MALPEPYKPPTKPPTGGVLPGLPPPIPGGPSRGSPRGIGSYGGSFGAAASSRFGAARRAKPYGEDEDQEVEVPGPMPQVPGVRGRGQPKIQARPPAPSQQYTDDLATTDYIRENQGMIHPYQGIYGYETWERPQWWRRFGAPKEVMRGMNRGRGIDPMGYQIGMRDIPTRERMQEMSNTLKNWYGGPPMTGGLVSSEMMGRARRAPGRAFSTAAQKRRRGLEDKDRRDLY